MRIIAVFAVGVMTLAASGWAQSLGEIAAKERERRKGKTTKVITEDDLARARGKNFSQPASSAVEPGSESETGAETSAGQATEGGKEKTEEELRAEKRADWQKRYDQAQAQADRLSQEVDDLQLRANDIGVSQFGPERTQLLDRLEKAKTELAAAQQQLEQLEDERRYSGY